MRARFIVMAIVAVLALIACSQAYGEDGAEDTPLPPRDGAADLDATTSDARTASDSADAADAADARDAGDPCDVDRDGFRAITCNGGDDCDDDDARAHPGAKFLPDMPTAKTKGDWDCSGTVEKAEKFNTSCPGAADSVSCMARSGFTTDPGCGQQGTFVLCNFEVLTFCQMTTTQMPVQRCR